MGIKSDAKEMFDDHDKIRFKACHESIARNKI